MIDHDPVQLLGHAPVERATTCLQMRHRNIELGGAQRTSQGGVCVALHQHHVWSLGQQDRLQPCKHACRLLAVRGRPDCEGVVWRGQA